MKEVILHIGMHKTGSTSIQEAFGGFKDGDTKYAALGYVNHSIPFFTAFAANYKKYHVWKNIGLSEAEIEDKRRQTRAHVLRELEDKRVKRLIFSGEDIATLTLKDLEEVKAFMAPHAAKIQVYAYVRTPAEFISSALQQTIKGGLKDGRAPSPKYRTRFEKFILQFGADSVFFREFSRPNLKDGSVVADFADWIGLRNAPPAAKYANESLSLDAARLIYLFNREGPLSKGDRVVFRARQRFIKAMGRALPGKFTLPPHLVREAIDLEDAQWMERVSGVRFDLDALDAGDAHYDSIDAFLSDIGDDLAPKLRQVMQAHAISGDFGDDLVKMLTRLFYSYIGYTGGFDPQAYLAFNPDIKAKGVNVYKHFVEHGVAEGRRYSEN